MSLDPRALLRRLVYRTPVLRVYAKARRLELVVQGQEQALEHYKAHTAGLEAQEGILAARVDELVAEVRGLWERRAAENPLEVFLPVRKEELLVGAAPAKPAREPAPPYTLNWVITPPASRTSGGHADIFRAIAHLESQGHRCRVYCYEPLDTYTREQLGELVAAYTPVAAELHPDALTMDPCDAIIATGWTTAYPVRAFAAAAKKIYFVQDYEPYFVAPGSYSALAASTYGFGFHGLTLGDWLAEKLHREHGMACDSFPFGVDTAQYELRNRDVRSRRIVFYARPSSERRGFELGVLALEHFHSLHPEYEIELIGEDIDRWQLPFPCTRRGVLAPDQLCELYNDCAAALVLSFTNMSLLPLELLACGCPTVVNDGANTRAVGFADDLHYADATPSGLAQALEGASLAAMQPVAVTAAAERARKLGWEHANRRIEEVLCVQLGDSVQRGPAGLPRS